MLSGHVLEPALGGIGPRQEFVDAAVGMAINDLGDDVGEVGLRIDGVEFAAFDQRCGDCPILGSAIGAGEERILPVQCYRPDAALDDIGIDLDPPVVKEVGKTVLTREGITDCLRELGLLADERELCAKPGFQTINDRPVPVLAAGAALVGGAAADVLLDRIEFGDAFECFGGNRRWPRGSEFVKPAANMGPAESKLHIVALGQRPITRIAVDLRDSREAGDANAVTASQNRPNEPNPWGLRHNYIR